MADRSEASDLDALTRGFARALGVAPTDELRRYVAEGQGKIPPGGCLLAWDANSVHGYVFDTPNATCIRGASTRLRGIDDDLRRGKRLDVVPEQILYSGGGSGMAVVPRARAEAAEARLHQLFADRTQIATCTTAVVPLEEGDGFRSRVQEVFRTLARNRFLAGSDAEPAVPFFVERCEVCGRRAAALRAPRVAAEPGGRLECEPCNQRVDAGRQSRRFEHEPSDFEDIADDPGSGFYAVVYTDGNGVGRLLSTLASPLAYARVSREIDRLLGTTVRVLARRYALAGDEEDENGEPRPRRSRPRGRYQLPICGGDDLVAILPGNVAVPFARDLVRELQAGADASPILKEACLGASAGVAISNVKFPVRHLLNEAEGLLKLAKRRVYRDKVRASLSFSVITDGSPRAESVTPELWGREEGEILLSGRPYSLEEIESFSERLRTLQAVPDLGKSQLYILLRHAHAGSAQLRSHILYQVGRRDEWRELVKKLSGKSDFALSDPAACVQAVVPRYGDRQVFDLADMLEVFDHWTEPEEASEP